jgi:glycosyltransferase involved in cell wall biosynthesis
MAKENIPSPLFSIITVNLNNAAGLRETLHSISLQSIRNYELIVIDGSSTDGSTDVIKEFSEMIECWISEKDDGIYSAMNKGIEKAHGTYCFFLNSGDTFARNNVLEYVTAAKPVADIVFGNLIVTSDGSIKGKIAGNNNFTFLDIYSSLLKHQSSFIKRELFKRYGKYDESYKISSDWAFFIRTAGLNSASLQYVDIDIAYFDNDGMSNRNPGICDSEHDRIISEIVPVMMQADYHLFKKYKGIRYIEKSKLGWLLFRVLAKTFKMLSK